ncbi:uncharacterized protein LOC135383823 [Ornithodoros turicata]|uniref:uncharacterized protein LOC135383823 n=1 Tax=Ornithodoros turicata TaxID=34597 RepID=UPI003139D712
MLFQSLWVEQISWDEEVPPDKQRPWQDWCEELINVTVDRCLPPCGAEDLQVHILCDASPKCYGAVAYLRAEKSGFVTSTLIFTKSRVAPLNQMTLPCLELMGAVIGFRMLSYLERIWSGLAFEYYLWADSTIVLWWIRKPPSEGKEFVSSRVQEVQQNTDTKRWNHCPEATNPADCLARGMPARTLSEKSTWWCGPHWLIDDPTTWPANDIEWDVKADEERTLKATVLQISSSPSPLLNVESFSTCRRLLRVTAWVLRFVRNTRRSTRLSFSWLTAEELRRAVLYWEKQTQSESYAEELSRLKERQPVSLQSKIASLRPCLDDEGVVRLKTRLQFGPEADTAKCPVLLPREHHFTMLVGDSAHTRTLHGGLRATLNEIREKWWVPQGRRLAKKVIFKCRGCAHFRQKAASAPIAPLPVDRVNAQCTL